MTWPLCIYTYCNLENRLNQYSILFNVYFFNIKLQQFPIAYSRLTKQMTFVPPKIGIIDTWSCHQTKSIFHIESWIFMRIRRLIKNLWNKESNNRKGNGVWYCDVINRLETMKFPLNSSKCKGVCNSYIQMWENLYLQLCINFAIKLTHQNGNFA